MVKGLYTAYTGMINEQNRMDILTNNLANSATTGYKKEGATSESFADVLAYKIKDTSEANIPKALGYMNLGVKIGENYTDYEQGAFRSTNNTFDLALAGKGFFNVEFAAKNGDISTMYSRDGSFTLNVNGELVDKNGDFLLDTNGNHIKLNPLDEAVVERDGGIYQNGALVAQIQISDFEDYNYLEKYGENYYQTVEGATEIASDAGVRSGYLEASNVQVVQEMVELINVTRAYETGQKIIQAMDGVLDTTVNQVGKV